MVMRNSRQMPVPNEIAILLLNDAAHTPQRGRFSEDMVAPCPDVGQQKETL